jgi:hypothetical protein
MEKVLMNEDRRSPNVSEKPINVQVLEPFIKAGNLITSDILPLVSQLTTVYLLR